MALLDSTNENVVAKIIPQTPQPGVLRSQAQLTIQTRYGQTFIMGRQRNDAEGKNQIPGLLDYARRTRLICLSVVADDPYADWQLLKIEQHLMDAKNNVRQNDYIVRELLESNNGIEIHAAHSVKPITVPLNFQNAYGYLAAALVSDYDQLACRVFSATHAGLLVRKAGFKMLNEAGSGIRRLFSATYQWNFTGVTRADIKLNNKNAERAILSMGECPQRILDMEQRAINAPEIKLSA